MAWVALEGPTAHLGYAWSADGERWAAPLWGPAERLLSARAAVASAPPAGFRERLYAGRADGRGMMRAARVVGVRDHGAGGPPWEHWSPGAALAALCRGLALDLELAE